MFRDIRQTVASECVWLVEWLAMPRPKVRVWMTITSFVGSTFFASVPNEMHGSRRLNNAHDFALKLMPWKQANEMFRPCNSIVPPRTMPFFGNGILSVDSIKPMACANHTIRSLKSHTQKLNSKRGATYILQRFLPVPMVMCVRPFLRIRFQCGARRGLIGRRNGFPFPA